MSSLPVPSRLSGSSDALRPALPAFESISHRSGSQGELPESSTSSSRRSQSKDRSNERTPERRSLLSPPDAREDTTTNGSPQHSRRASQRSSGGFLVGSIGRSSRIPRLLSKSPEDPKGKRKSEDSQLSIPKRRDRHVQTHSGSSLAGSPLSTEVTAQSIQQPKSGNRSLVSGNDSRQSMSGSRPGTMSTSHRSGQHLEIQRPSPPTFGYDTDPSQIVNMALSLSEARRRQASMKRYVSSDGASKRIISTASTTPQRSRIPTGTISKYLTPPQPASGNIVVNGRPTTPDNGRQQQQSGQFSPSDDMDLDDPAILDEREVSEATAARVERARKYFELAYEHRRVISHLPPIYRPGASVKSADPDSHCKAYNPLQYIRNRKLRIWDKTTINAEEEGWHDVEKVREWVDAVIGNHHESRHDPAEIVRLPPLSTSESRQSESEQEGSQSRPASQTIEQPKPRRPRTDWITHPGDMVADCFWTEQGMNKIKIRDRDNNQIYPPNTHFRFSGWRNRTPVDVPSNLQQPTPPPDDSEEDEKDLSLHSPAPELPTFKSAHNTLGKGHARKRSKIKDSLVAMEENGNRRKGLRLFMDDTSDDTDSEQSPGASDDGKERGRNRKSRTRHQKNSSSRSPVPESLRNTKTKDSFFASTLSQSDKSQPSSAQNSKRTSIDQSRFGHFLKRDSTRGTTPLNQSRTRGEHGRQESSYKFPSFHDRPRSSAEYDSTSPNSPVTSVWPSIAINLESPPQSRSPSPNKKKSSILHPFRDKTFGKHDKVDATDFADASNTDPRRLSVDDKQNSDYSPTASRGTSPMTRGQSPLSKRESLSTPVEPIATAGDHRGSTVSRTSTKSAGPSNDHSKIRGIFKGGRIAELVGHEVNRVGDFIWKRDIPSGYRRRGSTSSASTLSHGDSETEDGTHINGDVYKTPPRPRMRSRRASTLSSKNETLTSPTSSKSPQSGERPQLNNPNLPSFTSPFERDKDTQQKKQDALLSPTPSNERDHIARQAAEHRSASRSPRLDRLGALKLDTGRSKSATGADRQNSYGFDESLHLTRSRDASDRYNSAISEAGPGANRAMMANSLSRASVAMAAPPEDEPRQVTFREIDRATALLLCSAVKAREIGRRADVPGKQAPKYLLETMAADGQEHHHVDLSLVSKREEHVVAARIIMSRLSSQASAFDDKMKRFSASTAPLLHTELQRLEDIVDNEMTPRVRSSADEAGELSMKLSTTSTMAIKGLNDVIEGAFRRRRRGPIRWVRRMWYAWIEYAVVGLLWGIWAVVSLIRIVLAVIKGTTKTVRWLLWID